VSLPGVSLAIRESYCHQWRFLLQNNEKSGNPYQKGNTHAPLLPGGPASTGGLAITSA
jgi:hypothetical protein